ncbi:zinc ribbon domain-containing protein [Paraconexibacter sp.]|uniref:zinc ribbon domain-containing protein n=1 Tax=Paraconexibacter sp. TaxID=2949640 RepID=UPI00356B5951
MTPRTSSSPPALFCPECGARHDADAHFCEACGHALHAPEEPTAAAPAAPAPGPQGGGPPWTAIIIGAAVVLAAGAIALVLLLGGDDKPAEQEPTATYATQVAALLAPMNEANAALTQDLLSLDRGDDPDDALTSVRAAQRVARTAVDDLALLTTPADGTELEALIARALARERTFLTAAGAALTKPTTAAAADLGPTAAAARDAWRDTQIDGAGGRIAGVDRLAVWTRAEVSDAAARAKRAAEAKAKAEAEAKAKAEAEAKAKAEAQARQQQQTSVSCGGFEGIYEVFAVGVSCDVALSAAAFQVSGQGSSGGYTCRIVDRQADGLTSYTCSRGDGTQVNFSAYVG